MTVPAPGDLNRHDNQKLHVSKVDPFVNYDKEKFEWCVRLGGNQVSYSFLIWKAVVRSCRIMSLHEIHTKGLQDDDDQVGDSISNR